MARNKEKIFRHREGSSDPWFAYHDAESWLKSEGYSVGSMERGSPTAAFKGDCDISKWRNLSSTERLKADATIEDMGRGSFRDGDVVVKYV